MIEHSEIIKQSKAYKIVQQDVLQDRLAHSYMLISEDKETMESFVKIMLQTIFCHDKNACGKCAECVRIEHDNNPNIHITKKDDGIKVDDIKEIIADTSITAVEKGYKVYVIANAESMNEASQNKLLKTLEEPVSGVIIILMVSTDSSMLQTIKSRVKKIYLNVWDNENIAKELAKIGANSENIELAVKFGKGNLTKAKSLISDSKFQDCYAKMIDLLTSYTSTALTAQYLGHLGATKEDVLYSLSIIEGIISGTIYDSLHNIPNCLCLSYSVRTLANIADLIVDCTKRLQSNCNIQSVNTYFLLRLAEIKFLTA